MRGLRIGLLVALWAAPVLPWAQAQYPVTGGYPAWPDGGSREGNPFFSPTRFPATADPAPTYTAYRHESPRLPAAERPREAARQASSLPLPSFVLDDPPPPAWQSPPVNGVPPGIAPERPPVTGSDVPPDMEAYFRQRLRGNRDGALQPPARPAFSMTAAEAATAQPSDANSGPPSGRDGQRSPIGQAPERDINEVFLTQTSLLLKPGDMQYDVGFAYSWQEITLPVVVPPGTVAEQRLRRRNFLVPFSVRYGLTEGVELFGALPVGGSHLELSDVTGGDTATEGGVSDLTAGIILQILQHKQWPEITGRLDFTAPTGNPFFGPTNSEAGLGNGFWQIGAGLNFVKSYDPLVMFGSLGCRHQFEGQFMGINVEPGEIFSYGLGIAFAVNDDMSLSGEFFGQFQGPAYINGQHVPSSSLEAFGLRLALLQRLTPTRRLQPYIAIGLNRDAPDLSCGVLLTSDIRGISTPCPPKP